MEKPINRKEKQSQPNPKKSKKSCRWCGRQQHKQELCPAKDVICTKCQKKGHFQAVCLSKKKPMEMQSINKVLDLENVKIPFLSKIQGPGGQWMAQVNVNGHSTCLSWTLEQLLLQSLTRNHG